MEITNIKHFSEAYNNLREYLNKIEPCTYQQKSLFSQIPGSLTIRKGFNANDWGVPYNYDTFKNLYDSFIDELSNTILDYSQSTVMAMLKAHFVNVRFVFADSLNDVFKFDREDLIELIELFNEVTKLLYNLINDSETAHDYGLKGYYDSFKEESRKNREKRISGMQVKEGSYTDEDFENCIQKMFDKGTIDAIVNETMHEFLNDEDTKHIQKRTIKSASKDKKQTFESIIQSDDKEKLLKRLHYLIDNKGGADAGAVLLKAFIDGHLTQTPTRGMYESEFTLIGSWQGIHNYMSDNSAKALDKANKIIIFD